MSFPIIEWENEDFNLELPFFPIYSVLCSYAKKTPSPQLVMSAKTVLFNAPSGARTLDTLIKSQVLYQLS